MLGKISLGTLGITVGGILTLMGFIAYANDNATLNLVGFFYGIPLLLGGLALKANELKPIPYTNKTTPAVLELRKQQATVTQNKIRKDTTRFCYGQEGHFDRALAYLGFSQNEEETPVITGLRETNINGAYGIILEFDSPSFPIDVWQEKHEKMTKYFGPGVDVKITQPVENKVELALVTIPQSVPSN
jgi:hypothetical protein